MRLESKYIHTCARYCPFSPSESSIMAFYISRTALPTEYVVKYLEFSPSNKQEMLFSYHLLYSESKLSIFAYDYESFVMIHFLSFKFKGVLLDSASKRKHRHLEYR